MWILRLVIYILVEETKNGEIRRIPMNKKLTEPLESAKKSLQRGNMSFQRMGNHMGMLRPDGGQH
jgi:hypothetical protein